MASSLQMLARPAVLMLTCLSALGWAGAAPRPAPSAELLRAEQLLDTWQLEDAIALSSKLWLAHPEGRPEQVLAAEVLHQRGQHLTALYLLEGDHQQGACDLRGLGEHQAQRARSIYPHVVASAQALSGAQSVSTEHFRQHFVDKDRIVAHYAGDVLERAYRSIGGDLQFLPAQRGEPIVVEWLPSVEALAGATGLSAADIETSGTIAVCKFHRLMLLSPAATSAGYDWADTLAHELTHLIISKKSRNTVPVWLHEGLAKFYQSRWRGAPGLAQSQHSRALLRQASADNRLIPLSQMHPSMAKLPSQNAATLAFAEVFELVGMVRQRQGPTALPLLLADLGHSSPFDVALKRRAGGSVDELQSQLYAHIKQACRRGPAGPKAARAAAELVRLAPSGDDATAEGDGPLDTITDDKVLRPARLAELLLLRQHSRAAEQELQKAVALGLHRYATIDTRLARLWIARGAFAQADLLLRKTLANHPEVAQVQLLAGRTALAQHDFGRAKTLLTGAMLRNPYAPSAHQALSEALAHSSDPQGASREASFAATAAQPRAQPVPLPMRPTHSRLRAISENFAALSVDGGQPLSGPVWDLAAEPGEHTLQWQGPAAGSQVRRVVVPREDAATVVLRAEHAER